MRDIFKNSNYFNIFIQENYKSIDYLSNELRIGNVKKDRIAWVIQRKFSCYVQIIYAKYSMGEPIGDLAQDYQKALDFMYQSWMVLEQKAYKKGILYNHYYNGEYQDMLIMLSLGIMLHQPKETFITLAEIIDKDEVKDMLFEFILSSQIERTPLMEESYSVIQYIPKDYKSLREAAQEKDKTKAAKLVDKYFTKDWIKQVKKESGSFNPSTDIGYCGYWNFYVAAISYLLDIDVSNFEDNQYFPKDMYYYAIRNKNSKPVLLHLASPSYRL